MALKTVMKCESCGENTTRVIDEMCPECYLNNSCPTKVTDTPWVIAFPFRASWKKIEEKIDTSAFDEKLASDIAEYKYKLEEEKKSIRIGKLTVPLTVEALDDLATRTGLLVGKWLIYRDKLKIDEAWKRVAMAVFYDELAIFAKASTASQGKERHVICVYTYNYLDIEDVKRVRRKLVEMGFTEKLCYKPDIYTYLNIYSGTSILSPCRYRE